MNKILKTVGRQMQFPSGILGKILFSWMSSKTIDHAKWTNEFLDVQADDDVLEIGFGNGANLQLLLKAANKGMVTGAEISKTAMQMASKRNAKAISEGKLKLILAPGNKLPFQDNTFDKACTVSTAYVIEDPAAVFKEMYRVLKPNGRAAVTFPIRENFMQFKPVKTKGFYLHQLTDLQAAFRDAGFVNTRTERNDKVHFGAYCMLAEKSGIN